MIRRLLYIIEFIVRFIIFILFLIIIGVPLTPFMFIEYILFGSSNIFIFVGDTLDKLA